MILSKKVTWMIKGFGRYPAKIMIPAGKGGLVDSITLYNDGDTPVTLEILNDAIDITPLELPVEAGGLNPIYLKLNDKLRAPNCSTFSFYAEAFNYTDPFKVGVWLLWRTEYV